MSEFNLIDEPWIPCFALDGKQLELGIRDTLLKSHELREICDDSPLVTVAIHRLLLAILYRAYQGPADLRGWKEIFYAGSFFSGGKVVDYLDKWHNRFFLFDDVYPFMQVPQLDLNEYTKSGQVKKDKSDGIMRLAREAPDKGGRILFDHRLGTERPAYAPNLIARMLIAAQSYSGTGNASSGKIGTQHINPPHCLFAPCVDGICIYLQGENLYQTLLLNLVPAEISPDDRPAWEDEQIIDKAVRSWNSLPQNLPLFTGRVQRFAPLSRFIRVKDRQSLFFTNGLKVKEDYNDPMKVYIRPDEKKGFQPITLQEDKAVWRDSHTLFTSSERTKKPAACINHAARLKGVITQPLRLNAIGLATRIDKALLWRHERMPVPVALINDNNLLERLGLLLKEAEQAAIELNSRTRRIAKEYLASGRQLDNEEVNRVARSIDPRPVYWSRLEQHFYTLLENLPKDWDAANGGWKPDGQQNATNAWRKTVKREAQRALEESIRALGTTARAIQAVARVQTKFTDEDLKPNVKKAKRGKEK